MIRIWRVTTNPDLLELSSRDPEIETGLKNSSMWRTRNTVKRLVMFLLGSAVLTAAIVLAFFNHNKNRIRPPQGKEK